MTNDEVQWQLDDAIKMVTGKDGPFLSETRMAAIVLDSLETLELLITLEQKFDKSFDTADDSDIHAGTYGELLEFLYRAHGFTLEATGEYNPPYPHGWGKNHRDYRD